MSRATIELLSGPEFRLSVLIGSAISGAVILIWFLTPVTRPLPVGGLALAGGSLAVLSRFHEVPVGIWVGVSLAAIAGWLPLPRMVGAIATIPGAALIAFTLVDEVAGWIVSLLFLGIPLIGMIVSDFEIPTHRARLGMPMLSLTAIGIFFTVPDTDHALLCMGVAVPMALLGWPMSFASIGRAGAFAFVGLMIWVIAIDGIGRPASMVASVGAFGLLIAHAIGRWIHRWRSPPVSIDMPSRLPIPLILLSVQLGIVFVTARVAPLMSTVSSTAGVAVGALVVGGIVSAMPQLWTAANDQRVPRSMKARGRRRKDQ